MNTHYQEIDNIFKLNLAEKLELIEKVISADTVELKRKEFSGIFPANTSLSFSKKMASNSGINIMPSKRTIGLISLTLLCLLLCLNASSQIKANQSVVIGRIIDSTKGGGQGITLLDGTRVMARIINIGTATSDSASGHGSYGIDGLGGTFNGNNDESDSSPGSPGLTLPSYLGNREPTNFTRITSLPREHIDNGDASDFANAAGFHIWTVSSKPLRIKQLLLIDGDGAGMANNREWFTVIAYNDTSRVIPTFTVSTLPGAKMAVVNRSVSLNWYNLVKDSVAGIDTFKTAEIVRNTFGGSSVDYSGDPDNVNTQALADFGNQTVTDYFVFWGIWDKVTTTGGIHSSGLSPLLFEFEFDLADAPDTYGTTVDSPGFGPIHVLPNNGLSPQITLGDSITTEVDGQPGVSANLDYDDGVFRIDTVSIDTSVLSAGIATYTLKASVKNLTGNTARAVAWIDWNNNGVFDAAEGRLDSLAGTIIADTVVFTWSGQTLTRSPTADLSTYARIRLTTGLITTAHARDMVFQDGEVEDYLIPFAQIDQDFDDAPNSYGTTKASGGPVHIISADLSLGTGITVDSDGIPGILANGDTDDGVATLDSIYMTGSTASGLAYDYTLQTQYTNTSGLSANFAAWIDWNNNGIFETGEAKLVTTAAGTTSGTVSFTWTAPVISRADTSDKTTYVRIRTTTAVLTTSDFNNSTFQDGEVESYLINIKNAVSLPLSFLSFKASVEDNKVDLNWTVSDQTQINRYEILRSQNGRDFSFIGGVKANEIQTSYKWIDEQPFEGLNLYRLRSVNEEGKVYYSLRTLNVNLNKNQSQISIFPNPTTKQINFRNIEQGQKFHVRFTNSSGVLIMQRDVDTNNTCIDISELPEGTYYLYIFNGSEKIGTEKLQISNKP